MKDNNMSLYDTILSEISEADRKIFDKVNLLYRTADAERHIVDMFGEDFEHDRADCEILAERFIDYYDCNADENSFFESIINEYFMEEGKFFFGIA